MAGPVSIDRVKEKLHCANDANTGEAFRIAGQNPLSVADHTLGKSYTILGMTPDDFIKERGNAAFDFNELKAKFKKICLDYDKDLTAETNSRAVEFCSKMLFEVGPESRSVKKASGDKVWKFHFAYSDNETRAPNARAIDAANRKVVVKTLFVGTFKASEVGTAGEVDGRIMIVTTKQGGLLAMETFSKLIPIAMAKNPAVALLTPLCGAIFSRADVNQIAAELDEDAVTVLKVINASAQSGGQYLGDSQLECAVVCAVTATQGLAKRNMKERKTIINKITKQYIAAKKEYSEAKMLVWARYATGGVQSHMTAEVFVSFYEACQQAEFRPLPPRSAVGASAQTALNTLGDNAAANFIVGPQIGVVMPVWLQPPLDRAASRSVDSSPDLSRGEHRRTRSLNAPSPIQQFGPCGRIMKNSAMVMTIQDPASQRLTWYKPPLTVLVIKKVRDVSVLSPFVQLVRWLIEEKRMVVFVEQSVMDDSLLLANSDFSNVKEKLMTFRDGKDDLTDKIDFIICLGGDGTLLYASLLFQQSVPPVMAFHLGSLGFLTPFEFENFQEQVTNVLEGHAALTLRSRLRCIIMRKNEEVSKSKPPTNLLVLNEVVIDRGPSPYLSNIDLFLDGKHITSVQGDGLIVSTPTGSTAYAVAAGASMIHPSVPAIMVTPICPHSLSFRPIVVPAGVELKISVSPDSRNTAWVSFDGRNRQELFHGDSLRVTTSIYPVPSICAQDQISDWFDSLAECLHWNVRKRQKHLDELSDLTHSTSNDTLDSLDHTEQLDS